MFPSGSLEPDPSNITFRPLADDVNAATGSAFTGGAVVVTVWVIASVAESLSVTVRVTVKSPALSYTWLVVTPVAVSPSPKSHSYELIDPSGSLEALASNVTVRSSTEELNSAFGRSFGMVPVLPSE